MNQFILPTFVTAKLNRVPLVAPGDLDVYALAASLSAMSTQIESMSKRLEAAVSRNEVESLVNSVVSTNMNFPPLSVDHAATAQSVVSSASWLAVAWPALHRITVLD